ncbi:MAG: energy-coupling factor transporter transmembrane component T [Candidatus Promineifilaceae bacterium]|jgi:energy-coupling factor transport system permease protein
MKLTFHTFAWVVWLSSAAILTLIMRNPLYLIILLLVARVVQNACGEDHTALKISLWRLSAVIMVFSILFNLLLVHVGQTVLFRLPQNLWLIGGPLTLEAVIYGAVSALILITLLALFMAFNSIVSTSDLIAVIPRALANVGVVILIAVSYVPETLDHLQRVREAQALRGHRIRGLRDWQPIIIPLLVGGLERSMNLAETMVARGYGATSGEQLAARTRAMMLAGLILIFGGWILSFSHWLPGWLLILSGGGFLALAYYEQGRRIKRTRYKISRWQTQDWLLVLISLLPLLLILLPFPAVSEDSITYSPYPLAKIPQFNPLVGLAIALLAAPALLVELSPLSR